MIQRTYHRNAFTLVELLVSLVVLSLLAGMVIAAVQGVNQTAREARTRSIIDAIDSVLMEQYQSYKYRPFSVEIPSLETQVNSMVDVGFEILASESARVRLMMIRDMQRMEMPDRLSDIVDAPTPLYAAANKVVVNQAGRIVRTTDGKQFRKVFPVSWYGVNPDSNDVMDTLGVPSRLAAYRSRFPAGFDFTNTEALKNQGAECLYLIMATSFVGGSPAIDVIPNSSIGDTDNDGLPEILDGWGNPLGFIRWPVGYLDLEQSIDTAVADDVDLYRSDYAYAVSNATSPALATDVNSVPPVQVRPWSLRPLVFSAGADGEFGIATNPWSDAGVEQTNFSYRANWDWPLDVSHYGNELPGRASNNVPTFPDPYLRRFVETQTGASRRLPGQIVTPVSAKFIADNISNYK
ncbi:MAG: prepilin-type N-terminal cleavage/methylation domain-containing protein [Rubripirellula sp.]|nr:prepilin-type N-terminal cleavage/methylation domain-containing protein [Rubripirellula sp.]